MNMSSYKCCSPNTSEFGNIDSVSALLKLLAEPNRLRLLCLLSQKEHCVCDIIPHFDMSQSLISHHLSDLRQAGLVVDRRQGRQVYYSLTAIGQRITNNIFNLHD